MNELELLQKLNWPSNCLNDAGMLTWSKPTETGLLRAVIIRGAHLEIKLTPYKTNESDDLIEEKPLCYLKASVKNNGVLNFNEISIGHPPTTVEINDALEVFTFMTNSMGKAKFTSIGPVPNRQISPKI